jgi:hypothetical protein
LAQVGPIPRAFPIILSLIVLVTAPAGAQVTLVYRQATGARVDRIEISDQAQPDGAVLGVFATSGETYRIESDQGGGVTACRFEFPPERTSWTARREGTSLRLEGTVQGRPVSRTFAIDRRPWYESAERSLQLYAVSCSREPVRFWMVEPYGGSAYLMTGSVERLERVEVNGTLVQAVRVIVRPAGIMSFIWSSTYWYSPVDGTFLKSQSVRGILSLAPPTVIELLEDRRVRR